MGWVCLDEYYMFNSLYGLLQNQPAADFQQRVLLDRFNAQYADQSPVVPEEPPQQRVVGICSYGYAFLLQVLV